MVILVYWSSILGSWRGQEKSNDVKWQRYKATISNHFFGSNAQSPGHYLVMQVELGPLLNLGKPQLDLGLSKIRTCFSHMIKKNQEKIIPLDWIASIWQSNQMELQQQKIQTESEEIIFQKSKCKVPGTGFCHSWWVLDKQWILGDLSMTWDLPEQAHANRQ